MSTLWGALTAAIRAGLLAWASLWEARQRGRAEEAARHNAEAAEAERRAAEVREQSREDTANRLERGEF